MQHKPNIRPVQGQSKPLTEEEKQDAPAKAAPATPKTQQIQFNQDNPEGDLPF